MFRHSVRACMLAAVCICHALAWEVRAVAQEPPLGGGGAQPGQLAIEGRDCGAHCLFVALRSLDVREPSYQEVLASLGTPGVEGFSMQQLAESARAHGLQAMGVVLDADRLSRQEGRFACIARTTRPDGTGAHFLNIIDVREGKVIVIDPPRSEYEVPVETFAHIWDGTVLLLSREPLSLAEPFTPWRWGLVAALVGGVVVALGAAWAVRRFRA